jgi:hypothetical protein
MIWDLILKLNKITSKDSITENARRFELGMIGTNMLYKLGLNFTSRAVEIPWLLENLKGKSGKILDVGCCDSFLPYELIKMGFSTYATDIRNYHHDINFTRSDITKKTKFKPDIFDYMTCISVIEHIGLGSSSYGDVKDSDGDIKAMREMRRILRGDILLTTHYSSKYTIDVNEFSLARLYDKRRLNMLTRGFTIIKEQHFVRFNNKYSEVSKNRADRFKPVHRDDSIVCLVLRKRAD